MANTIDKKKLSGYSAILAILVVLIHTENLGLYPSLSDGSSFSSFVNKFEWLISKNIASVAVPSFFMISGILFYRDFKISLYPKKLKSRFFSLILPYLLWNLFRFFLFYCLGKVGITEKLFLAPRLLFTKENFIDGLFFYKYNLGFWFMYQLILFTIFSPVIRLITKNKWVGLFAIIALVTLNASDILGELLIVTFKKRFILLDCAIYYIIGAYIGTHFFDFVNKSNKFTKILSVIGIVAGQAFGFLFAKTGFIIFNTLSLVILVISFWYFYDALHIKPLPVCITSITFFIYAGHGTVLEFLQATTNILFGDSVVFAFLTYLTFPVITLGILVGVSLILKKFLPKFWSLINGAR